ncbi:MAG: NAD-dependent epimerase/dehydratase family protein [Actinobacteria bacterium]|nr:NAD-dependent epimerase/dehydratase family protein [Actinomycetota bacterium]
MGNNRIVIFGAAGFIGYHLALALAKNEQCEVVLVDNFVRSEFDSELKTLISSANCKFIEADARDAQLLEELIKPGDVVYNLVAFNGTDNFYEVPSDVISHSALTGINIARVCATKKVKKYYYFGSSESYAGGIENSWVPLPTPEKVPFVISDPSNPRWSYAISKQIGEMACYANGSQYGLDFLIFRIHNIYGPRMGFDHVVPDLIRKFAKGDGTVLGPDQTRSFLYIDDAIKLILELSIKSEAGDMTETLINIGSDSEVRIQEIADILKSLINPALELVSQEAPAGSVARRKPDLTLLRKYLSFNPLSITEGLVRTKQDYFQNNRF